MTSFRIDVRRGMNVRPPKGDVVLEVSGVTAAKPPGFIAAVFVGDERVGEVSLYAYDTPQSFAFPAGAAGAAGVVFAGPSLFDIEELLAQPNWVRPDIATASTAIINGYKTAITAMRALPASNPRSWAYQAAIHGTTVTPALTAWNTCQHGNFFFLSWHRMYLYWFERIVRSRGGFPSGPLPFGT